MVAFVVGALFPGLHVCASALPWLVGIMLTITLVGMDVSELKPQGRHFVILGANLFLGLLPWGILRALGYHELAEAAFFAGITGEAASAPVIVNMLGGRSEFAAVGLALNSVSAAIAIPLLAPFIITPYGVGEISRVDVFCAVMEHVAAMLLLPCIAAAAVRRLYPASRIRAKKLSLLSLGMWLFCMSMVSALGVTRVRASQAPWEEIAPIAGVIVVMCAVSFCVGRLIGRPRYALEC